MPHHSFIEKNTPDFSQSTQMALESPKFDICHKLTKRDPRRCLKLSWDQIWQKKFQWEVSQIADKKSPCMIL